MLVCLVSATNKQSSWLKSFPEPLEDMGGNEKEVLDPFFSTSASYPALRRQLESVSLPWAFHKPRMSGCLFLSMVLLLPFSCPIRTPVPHFWRELVEILWLLWIALQLLQLLTKRCTLYIFIITMEKLILYIRVRLDFISVGMTITSFLLVLITPSTPKSFINFRVSRPIFSDLQFNYSTFDIHVIECRLTTAFCLKISTSCIFLQFCLPSNLLKILSLISWVTSQLGIWSWNTYTTFFNLLKGTVCRIDVSSVKCSANAESKAHGIWLWQHTFEVIVDINIVCNQNTKSDNKK